MGSQTIPQQKRQISHQPTPRDDAKKVVSEILKRVDQLIHKGELDHAQLEITKAKEVDPRNVYIFALEERISILKAECVSSEETQHKNELKSLSIIERVSLTETEIPQRPTSSIPQSSLEVSLSAPAINASPLTTLSFSPAPADTLQERSKERISDRSADRESYRQALTYAWCDGALTDTEERQLNELRMVFDITKAESEQIENNVKHECYRDALLRLLSDSSTEVLDSMSITDLQRTFQISDEEHRNILTQLTNTKRHKERDKVLIIDDDTWLLELLTASLEDSGFDVTALPTSDEAYALLRKFIPDVILCDINLETSTMGGFTFYEKVQELKNIQSIPFVFLTGLTDETLIRTGKELGVDDYLMKPISEQTLVSALRGKLKRFRQLNKIMTASMPAMAAA
jgi:CheY-like chemotaxis protein